MNKAFATWLSDWIERGSTKVIRDFDVEYVALIDRIPASDQKNKWYWVQGIP